MKATSGVEEGGDGVIDGVIELDLVEEGGLNEVWLNQRMSLQRHRKMTRTPLQFFILSQAYLRLDHQSSLLSYVVHHLVSQSKLAVTHHRRRCLWWCDWSELQSVSSASGYLAVVAAFFSTFGYCRRCRRLLCLRISSSSSPVVFLLPVRRP
ncbi:uncharacterized protein G2W53_001686 [Senna tora]|uniref:Uncharacterized protein n=1 Tax=Senna tora TaxID=362788 RepID=A0A835CIS4_9FABA|nr:uncharacterized protein G2W53_001686 [Senna tora]